MQVNKNYLSNQSEEDTLNLRSEFEKYLIYWRWFVFSIILSIISAIIYLKYSVPQYSAKTVVLIKENKNGGISAEMKAFEDLGILGGSTNNIDNEMEIIKSRKIIGDVIKKMDYTTSYFAQGRLKEFEVYVKYSPIKIEFLKKDSLFYNQDTIINIKNITNSTFDLSSEDGSVKKEYVFGDNIKSELGVFKVINQVGGNSSSSYGTDIKVEIKSLNKLINFYKNRVNISPVNKNSSVLTLSITSSVKKKAEDFLNALVDLYNKDAIEDKNQVSKKTKEFIDDRLDIVGKNLSIINDSLQLFKTNNHLTDIEAESKLILQALSENTKNIAETNIEISIIKPLIKKINDDKDNSEVLPPNLVFSDPTIATSIFEYNKLLLEKKKLQRTATSINILMIDLTSQITALKSSLVKSLSNIEGGLQLKLSELKKEELKIRDKISSVPVQELLYVDIKLQQEIFASLYTYLLKKKEETDISLAVTVSNAKIIDKAYVSNYPVSPNRKIIFFAAIFFGILIPFAFLYLKNLLDSKVHNKKDIEDNLSVPFLGDVPKSDSKEKIVIGQDARSSSAEAFRLLRTNLDFMLTSSKNVCKTIFITSTTSGEGKSFISINTAASLALSGNKVLLIGMDLRAPKVTEYLGLPDRKGVTNYITDEEMSIEELIFNIDGFKNLDIISSGVIPPNPAELLMTKRTENMFTILRDNYDYIIVDTAPVNLVTDTLLIAKYADMFMYVTRANYLDKRLLAVPQNLYNEKRLPNMAMVLNDTDPKRSYGYGYGYGGYGYGYVVEEKPWYKKIFNRS